MATLYTKYVDGGVIVTANPPGSDGTNLTRISIGGVNYKIAGSSGDGSGEPNVQVDWNETDTDSDTYILNKPTIPASYSDLTGSVPVADIPAAIARDAEVTAAIAAVRQLPAYPDAGSRSNMVVKFNNDTLEWAVDAGITAVSSDATLTGEGNTAMPLKVANPLPTLPAEGSRNNKILKFSTNTLGWETDSSLIVVASDATLTGSGTLGSTLKVANPLPALPDEGSRDDKVLKFDGNTLGWEADAVGTAGSGEENVQANWSETDVNADSYIENKPTIPSALSDLTGTVTDGQIPAGIARDAEVTAAVAAVRQLPVLPDAGSRNDKILKFADDVLGWEADTGLAPVEGALSLAQVGTTSENNNSNTATSTGVGKSDVADTFLLALNYTRTTAGLNMTGLLRKEWIPDIAGTTTITGAYRFQIQGSGGDYIYLWFNTSDSDELYFSGQGTGITSGTWDVAIYNTLAGDKGDKGDKGDPGDLTTVASDATLTGDGTSISTLKVAVPLPTLPTAGSRNDKVLKFADDALGWEADAGEANVQADWSQATNTEDSYIKNKPTIPASYTDLTGSVPIADIPAGIARDTEVTAAVAAVRQLPAYPDTGSRDNLLLQFAGDALGWRTPVTAIDDVTLTGNGVSTDIAVVNPLPNYPGAGSRDNKIPKFDGDTLGWEVDAGGGTTVVANPAGTDGSDLTRIAIGGTNYNLAAGSGSGSGSGGGFEVIGEVSSFSSDMTSKDTGIDIPGDAADDDLFVVLVNTAPTWFSALFQYKELAATTAVTAGAAYDSENVLVVTGSSGSLLYFNRTAEGDLLYNGVAEELFDNTIRLGRITGGGGGSGVTIHTYSRDPGEEGDADVGKDNDWWFNISREETLIAWNKVGGTWVRLIDLDDSFNAIAHRLDYDDQRLSFVKSTEDVTGWALATAEQGRAGYKRVIKETSDLANTTFALSDFFDIRDTQLMGDANATWVFAMAVPKGIHPDHVQIVVEKGATDIFFPGADTHWELLTGLTGANPLIDYYFLANDSDDSLHGWGSGTGGYAGAGRIATSTTHLRWVYDPPLIGEATFDLDGSVTNQKLLDASNDPIVCPADGWLDFALNVPRIGLSATVERVRCVDLRAAARSERNAVGLYTNSANEIFLRVPSHSRASTGNTVSVYRVESPSG